VTYLLRAIGTLHADCEIVDDKTNLAKNELSTGGYALFNAGLTTASFEKFGAHVQFSAGIQNILNRVYVNFLSTLRGNLNNEPGRNIFFSATVTL